jgi:hypothetical protein
MRSMVIAMAVIALLLSVKAENSRADSSEPYVAVSHDGQPYKGHLLTKDGRRQLVLCDDSVILLDEQDKTTPLQGDCPSVDQPGGSGGTPGTGPHGKPHSITTANPRP